MLIQVEEEEELFSPPSTEKFFGQIVGCARGYNQGKRVRSHSMGPGRPFYLSFLALAQMLPRKVYFFSLYKSDKEVFSAPMSVGF